MPFWQLASCEDSGSDAGMQCTRWRLSGFVFLRAVDNTVMSGQLGVQFSMDASLPTVWCCNVPGKLPYYDASVPTVNSLKFIFTWGQATIQLCLTNCQIIQVYLLKMFLFLTNCHIIQVYLLKTFLFLTNCHIILKCTYWKLSCFLQNAIRLKCTYYGKTWPSSSSTLQIFPNVHDEVPSIICNV